MRSSPCSLAVMRASLGSRDSSPAVKLSHKVPLLFSIEAERRLDVVFEAAHDAAFATLCLLHLSTSSVGLSSQSMLGEDGENTHQDL